MSLDVLKLKVCLCFNELLVSFQTKAGLVVPGEGPSLLLSPSVFQQSTTKAPELPRNPAPPQSPPASLGAGELPSTVYSKAQLQDVLIHLIKVYILNGVLINVV